MFYRKKKIRCLTKRSIARKYMSPTELGMRLRRTTHLHFNFGSSFTGKQLFLLFFFPCRESFNSARLISESKEFDRSESVESFNRSRLAFCLDQELMVQPNRDISNPGWMTSPSSILTSPAKYCRWCTPSDWD